MKLEYVERNAHPAVEFAPDALVVSKQKAGVLEETLKKAGALVDLAMADAAKALERAQAAEAAVDQVGDLILSQEGLPAAFEAAALRVVEGWDEVLEIGGGG